MPTPPPPLFVLGASRSGTSFLTQALSAHPEVHIFGELRILKIAGKVGAALRRRGRPPPPDQDLVLADFQAGLPFARAVLAHRRRALGVRWIGDKYPPYTNDVPLLDHLFPGAHFLHIVRDGRAVVASMLRAFVKNRGWRFSTTVVPLEEMAATWAARVANARGATATIGPGRALELRYEDLVAAPQATAARLRAFLDLPAHPAMTAAFASAHPGTDWRRALSPAEQARFAAVPEAEACLAALGYPATVPAPPDPAADAWHARARAAESAGDRRAARDAWLRAAAAPDASDAALAGLLAHAQHGGAAFAAAGALARTDRSPAAAAALRLPLATWLQARGLSAEDAAALLEPPS